MVESRACDKNIDYFRAIRAGAEVHTVQKLNTVYHRVKTLPYLTEMESRTQGSRPTPRTQKKSEAKAKDSLSEDRTSRGQGQQCSRPRPRTKDTGASVLPKKNVFKNFFQAISNSLAYPEFLIGGGPNHKSHGMKSSKFFQRGSFCRTNIL